MSNPLYPRAACVRRACTFDVEGSGTGEVLAWFRPRYHFSFHDRTAISSLPKDDQPFELVIFDFANLYSGLNSLEPLGRWVRKARWKSALPKNKRN